MFLIKIKERKLICKQNEMSNVLNHSCLVWYRLKRFRMYFLELCNKIIFALETESMRILFSILNLLGIATACRGFEALFNGLPAVQNAVNNQLCLDREKSISLPKENLHWMSVCGCFLRNNRKTAFTSDYNKYFKME